MITSRIYACYSESHRPLLEKHFLPSIPDGFDVVLRRIQQSCPSATYGHPGWDRTMLSKIDFILDAISREKQPFVLSDVDVRFYDFRPDQLASLLPEPYVAAYQLDIPLERWAGKPKYCAGFSIFRPSEVLKHMYEMMRLHLPRYKTEQHTLYAILANLSTQCATYLPQRFWNLKHGDPGPDIAIDHASWVEGVEEKIRHLDDTLRSTRLTT